MRVKISFDGLNLEDARDLIDSLCSEYGATSRIIIESKESGSEIFLYTEGVHTVAVGTIDKTN